MGSNNQIKCKIWRIIILNGATFSLEIARLQIQIIRELLLRHSKDV
jgi:hypothetical protein